MKRIVVAVALVGLFSAACETDSTSDSGIDQGLGSEDASGDVSLGRCSVEFKIVTCDVDIHNGSEGRSDYYIEGSIEDSSATNVGSGNALATGIEPGQSAKTDFTGTISGSDSDVTVAITQVQRTAS